MRTIPKCSIFLMVAAGLVGIGPGRGDAQELHHVGTYMMVKGGIYSPSSTFNFGNLDLETTFEGDTKTGVDGEVALGHYFLPTLALELGLGYFKGTGSFQGATPLSPRGKVEYGVIPLIVSAKALIPVDSFDPYGELGIGAYFTNFNVSDNLNSFSGNTTFGAHAGAGLNVNLSKKTFVGLEGRYVWSKPKFGGQTITLNGTDYSLHDFHLNGFTTTLGFGYSF
jgi:outer membrane protein W